MIDLENSQSNHYGISSINLLFCLWKFQKSKVTSLWLIELISKVRHFKTQDYKARKYVLFITFLDWSLFCFYPFWLAIVIIDKNNDNIYISKRALHMLNIVSHVHRFKHDCRIYIGYTCTYISISVWSEPIFSIWRFAYWFWHFIIKTESSF